MQIYIGRRGASFTKPPWGDSGGWSVGVVDKAPPIDIRFFEGQLAGWELAFHGEAAVPEPLLAGENIVGEKGAPAVRLSDLATLLDHVLDLAASAGTDLGRVAESLGDIEIVVDYHYIKDELNDLYAIIGPQKPRVGKYGVIDVKRINSGYVEANATIDVWSNASIEIDSPLYSGKLGKAPYKIRFTIFDPRGLSRAASLIQSEPVLGEPEGIPVIHAPEEKKTLSLPANAPVLKIIGGEANEQEGFRVYDYSYDRTQLYTMIYAFDKSAPVPLEVTEEGIYTRGPSDLETLIIDAYALYGAFKLREVYAFIDVGIDRAYMVLQPLSGFSVVGKLTVTEVLRYTFTSTIVEGQSEKTNGFVEVSTNLMAPIDITGAPGILVEAYTERTGKPVYPNEKIWNDLVAKYYEALGLIVI